MMSTPEDRNSLRTTGDQLTAQAVEIAQRVLDHAQEIGGEAVHGFLGKRVLVPRYGENPWQSEAGLYADPNSSDPLAIHAFDQHQGKDLSFNNLCDVDRSLQTITHATAAFDISQWSTPTPQIAIGIKHGNACGAGVSSSDVIATRNMLEGDKDAIFGGVVALNYGVDKDVANALLYYGLLPSQERRFLEVVAAPYVTDEALSLFNESPNLRILTNAYMDGMDASSLATEKRVKDVRGGKLIQDNYTYVADLNSPDIEIWGTEATERQKKDMLLAWAIGSTSTSNTITLVKQGLLIANGVGQQSRVRAAKLAIWLAKDNGHDPEGSAGYTDSFFPFPDGALVLVNGGVRAIFGLRGSTRDDEVKEALAETNVTFYTLPNELARGFYH